MLIRFPFDWESTLEQALPSMWPYTILAKLSMALNESHGNYISIHTKHSVTIVTYFIKALHIHISVTKQSVTRSFMFSYAHSRETTRILTSCRTTCLLQRSSAQNLHPSIVRVYIIYDPRKTRNGNGQGEWVYCTKLTLC